MRAKLLLTLVVADHDGEIQARFEMCGNGRPGSNASGVSTGKYGLVEVGSACRSLLLVQVRVIEHLDARSRQCAASALAPALRCASTSSFFTSRRMATSCADGLIPSGPVSASPLHLRQQPGHPDHEELVQVGADNRQELHALQQWICGVSCLLEYTLLKSKQAQFAIDVQGRFVERR